MSPPIQEEDEEEQESSEDIAHNMAVTLLSEVTEGGFNRLRNQLTKSKWTNTKTFPSFYTLKKSRPAVENLQLVPIKTSADPVDIHEAQEIDDPFASASLDELINQIDMSEETILSS